ncbi:hypothetical protein HQ38_02750 [Porphyromonas crevioricanis]|uniref:Uncharacterized protein n=1 Tax=Porphyromonas crevioricanis TaxID=393921 RepID=A0AB34PH59_9PORP|nr:hypothetical protein HQ38_02750 [Porphyromonas crevioricanis]
MKTLLIFSLQIISTSALFVVSQTPVSGQPQGNRIKNLEKTQVANFQMIAFRRLYSKIKNALKTMIDNQALTF